MAQLILQPNSAAGKDTYVADEGLADSNFGGNDVGIVGTHATAKTWEFNRCLFEYDFSADIPAGSIIDSAEFLLTKQSAGLDGGSLSLSLRRLTEDWTELGATWIKEDGTLLWTTAGADHNDDDHTLTDKVDVVYTGADTVAFTVDDLVREAFANQSGIASWLLLGDEWDHEAGPSDYLRVWLDAAATASNRPKLTINYTPPLLVNDAFAWTADDEPPEYVGTDLPLDFAANDGPLDFLAQ